MCDIFLIEIPDNNINFTNMYLDFFLLKHQSMTCTMNIPIKDVKRCVEIYNVNVNTTVNYLRLYYFACTVRVLKYDYGVYLRNNT